MKAISYNGNYIRPDQTIGDHKAKVADDESTNDIADYPIASPTHHPAREKASKQSNKAHLTD